MELVVGILQRCLLLQKLTLEALFDLNLPTIVIESTPIAPLIQCTSAIHVIHEPDEDGYHAIFILKSLFREFLTTTASRLLLIEGDMVLSAKAIEDALFCTTNTKIFYKESDPCSPNAYVRCEGMAGLLMRSEIERIYDWMCSQKSDRFRQFEGYHDIFLWFSVSDECNKSFPVLHITHGDTTRVTKRQRLSNKNLYRKRKAQIIQMAIECRSHLQSNSTI